MQSLILLSRCQSEAACVIFDDELSPVIDRLQPTSPNVRLWVSMQDTSRPYARSYASLLKIGRPLFPAEPNVATMIYTGGTSGKPKAALRNKPNSTAGQWLRAVDMHLHGRVRLCERSAHFAYCARF